jgi:hypothetical protein
MLEVTEADVARLDDKQLRELVGLLCESELRRRGLSPAAVTYGGDQNAADGGLDVHVVLPVGTEIRGFIPRPATGFQVKRQEMPPGAIAAEMMPRGAVRPSIAALAGAGGAYVIVSSQDSTTHEALLRRKAAMANAVEALPNAGALALDFYDRSRIVTWIHDNPRAILWVRRKIGRAVQGWEPYGPWSYPSGSAEAEYLLDDGVKICLRPATPEGDLATVDGIEAIRAVLRAPRGIVRLVGLSGLGKTRLAQALFDERIGAGALDRSSVFYTNMNDAPDPQPGGLASDLVAVGTRAILVIDNCAPDLHARLAEIARKPTSQLSVLTIEYDIREDQPEGTDVYEVRAASIGLIEGLLRIRFPGMSQVDAHTAAEASGGNARIALGLAETVARGGSLQHLTDDQLFQRLFVQRQDRDRRLLDIAQACSLLYSFNGEDVSESDAGELARIGRMIGASADEAHRATAELLRRELAQRRGVWRAVLPHAIANRLAARALQDIPRARVEASLMTGAPERIQRSFSRRLGFLHASPEARALVSDWFSATGLLYSLWCLSDHGRALFESVLPVDPAGGLAAIERSVPAHGDAHPLQADRYLWRALRSIAYDAALFERAASVLQLICAGGDSGSAKTASDVHTSLFWAVLSGSHATVAQRVGVARRLIHDESVALQALGVAALDAMLKTMHFSSSYDFQFGSHSRDYGSILRTRDEFERWYRAALALAVEIAESGSAQSGAVRSSLAMHFRGIWSRVCLWAELEEAALRLGASGRFWRDGWQAVKQTRQFDAKDKASESYARLSALEVRLRPTDLIEQVRGRALGSRNVDFDVDDLDLESEDRYGRAMERKRTEVETLGETLARDGDALRALLPELVKGPGQLWPLGIGLAKGAKDPRPIWQALSEQVSRVGDKADVRVLCGLLEHLRTANPSLAEELLDDALTSEPLAPHFPRIQSFAGIDQRGIDRLLRSLELGRAGIGTYHNLSLGRATNRLSGESLARFLSALGAQRGGDNVALDILHMQFFIDRQERRQHAPELIAAGRDLLAGLDLSRAGQRDDHTIGVVVSGCLSGDDGYAAAVRICDRLLAAVDAYATSGVEHHELLAALFRTQPQATLDALLGADERRTRHGLYLLRGASQVQGNPLAEVSDAVLLEWAGRDPAVRHPTLASVVDAFSMAGDKATGWQPIASTLVHSAPDPIAVLRRLIRRLDVESWTGSQASALESNAALLGAFDTRDDPTLAAVVASHKARLRAEADRVRAWENDRDRRRDETFE